MTTRDNVRRAAADARLRLGGADEPVPTGPALPDRLAAARERKGVDLLRAERDTKIRVRYLSALERGDYRDLPGNVYTKGFLRNYAIYLGLDPEDVLRQWRRERGDQVGPEPAILPPLPLAEPSRPLNFSPSVVVAALMTVGVIVFGIYLTAQLLRYARPPELAVLQPAQAVLTVEDTATSYRISGTATPGSTIEIRAPGRDDQTVTALANGEWSVEVDLRRGQNRFEITARNPETGKVAESPRTLVITVPFLVIQAPTLSVSQPVDGTTFENGAIPVEGMTTNATSVTVTAQYLGPIGASPAPAAPAPTPGPGGSPSSSQAPGGTTVEVSEDGSFSLPLQLTTGRWAITITATSAEGKTASLTRQVSVAYKGVNLVVAARGGPAWIKVWIDGVLTGPAGGLTLANGRVLTFTAKNTIEVRTGSSGVTFFTLNGVSLGSFGRAGVPETWLFAPPAAPAKTQRQ